MASIHRDPKSKTFRVMFRYGGKQYQKSLKTIDPAEAEALRGRIELTLLELEKGRKFLPPDADLWEFVWSDGHRTRKAQAPDVVTLDRLFTRFSDEVPAGATEENSQYTKRIHMNHLLRLIGRRTAVTAVTTDTLQRYINDRSKEKFRGTPISPRTVKKEVSTLSNVWNWGKPRGLVTGDAPTRGLRYEKEDERPGFLTWDEIESRTARGGLTETQVDELWQRLFLSREQVAACLGHVKASGAHPFVYPMFVFVAHTGARRSEMVRSRVEDIDLAGQQVRIREKKRNHSVKETSRYVKMTPLLEEVMRGWLNGAHPGGPYTFCQSGVVARSRKRSKTTGHQHGPGRASTLGGRKLTIRDRADELGPAALTPNEATDHFKRTLAGSKWAVVRGFHVFRHSIASNLAVAGTRQEVIDGILGHQTEDMRRRYRHLFPQETQDAMRKALGG